MITEKLFIHAIFKVSTKAEAIFTTWRQSEQSAVIIFIERRSLMAVNVKFNKTDNIMRKPRWCWNDNYHIERCCCRGYSENNPKKSSKSEVKCYDRKECSIFYHFQFQYVPHCEFELKRWKGKMKSLKFSTRSLQAFFFNFYIYLKILNGGKEGEDDSWD